MAGLLGCIAAAIGLATAVVKSHEKADSPTNVVSYSYPTSPPETNKSLMPASKAPPKLYSITVVLYGGANIPTLVIDGQTAQADSYSSPEALLRLQGGTHHLVANYPTQVCEAQFTVPGASRILANCSPK